MAKILIVEDDKLISRVYYTAFVHEQHTVELASTGEEGLMKVKTFQPDIILLDIMMPEMSGIAVLESLKKDPATQAVPVIMLTNLAPDSPEAADALAKGAAKCITKSDHEPVQMVEMITQFLQEHK